MSFMDVIKDGNWEKILKTKIKAEDIRELANYYEEIEKLKELYNSSTVGRKLIAEEIREKLIPIQTFTYYLKNRMEGLDSDYEYAPGKISDFDMAMRLLLRLANLDSEKYILKRFGAEGMASFEVRHGDREHAQIGGNIWVIGKKSVLDKIDNRTSYYGSEFGKISDGIVKRGHSLIVATDHYFDTNVKPFGLYGEKLKEIEIRGTLVTISCYLYEDELGNAVDKFMAFINQNGADIKGIDEDELFNLMAYPDNVKEDEPQTRVLKP